MQKNTISKSSRTKGEKGSVLAELTLILPMITFLVLAVTDFGMFLQTYFQVCHIAREGLRTAESTPDLQSTVANYARYRVTTDTPAVIASTGVTSEHRFIHDRIQLLLRASNGSAASHSLQLSQNAVDVTTTCVPSGGLPGTDRVEVEVAARYQPITPFNDMLSVFGFDPLSFTFTTKSLGTYLFDSCAA